MQLAKNSIFVQIEYLHTCGYSVSQFIIDSGYKNIILYCKKESVELFESTLLGFRLQNRKLNYYCVSDEEFQFVFTPCSRFGSISFAPFEQINYPGNSICIILEPLIDRKLESQIVSKYGISCLHFPFVIRDATNYMFIIRPLLYFQSINPSTSIITFDYPKFPEQNLSDNENNLKTNNVSNVKLRAELAKGNLVSRSFDEFGYSITDLQDLIRTIPSYVENAQGVRKFRDFHNKFITTTNGLRTTVEQPCNSKRNLFMLGGCLTVGIGAPDKCTIASTL